MPRRDRLFERAVKFAFPERTLRFASIAYRLRVRPQKRGGTQSRAGTLDNKKWSWR